MRQALPQGVDTTSDAGLTQLAFSVGYGPDSLLGPSDWQSFASRSGCGCCEEAVQRLFARITTAADQDGFQA